MARLSTVALSRLITRSRLGIFRSALTLRAAGSASGFFVQDTLSTGAILFDVAAPSSLSFVEQALAIEADLLVSPEFAGFLGNVNLTGATVGSASINGAAVPEPTTILGILAAGGF